MLNTRHDYEYVQRYGSANWRQDWYNLLDGRFIVDSNELIEDQNAPIFRLGFTVAEVADAVGHTGYTRRELEWYQSQPERYELVDGRYVQVSGWASSQAEAELAAAVSAKKIELQREKVARRDAGIEIDGILWDTDMGAQTMYTQFAVGLATNPGLVITTWKASAGVFVPMDAAQLQQITTAWTLHCSTITATQRQKEEEIAALVAGGASAAEIEAYDVTAGF